MSENQPIEAQFDKKNDSPKAERTWAVFCHLSSFVAFLGIPFGNVLGPLVLWLIKKSDMPLVDAEGKAAINFQISMTIYTLVAVVLCFIAIGFLLIFPVILFNIIVVIIATVKTSNGEKFQYPCTIHFLK